MASVWSSRCTQRSTKASSSSSISSKSRFASASLVSGHNLSAGCSSGEPEGRNSRCIPSGTSGISTSPPVCHPALCPLLKGCAAPLRLPLFGELSERHREQLHVDPGQDEPVHLPAFRPHETVEVSPLVAPLEPGDRPLS